MLMLEHDAKVILAQHGVPVPQGILTDGGLPELPFEPPYVAKAQVPAGGRGKAGGIRAVERRADVARTVSELVGMRLRGHAVREVRIEQAIAAAREVYLSLSIDPRSAAITVLVSVQGGVDVEEAGAERATAAPTADALGAAVDRLAGRLEPDLSAATSRAGRLLASAFLALDLTLLEINPLFVRGDGSFIAGDAKLIVDDNALPRQEALRALLRQRARAYPDVVFKLEHGFDLVVLDPEGEIGLVTTGAGLSMQLIDELIAGGARPFNFLDIRSGGMRGSPERLIEVLRRIARAPRIRVVLVNIFAGITELGEFARLLIAALEAVPELGATLVVRLVGNGEREAAALLEGSERAMILEPELDRAVALAVRVATGEHARHA
jgi:succinyl-CoA synthetase beta subunit